MKVLSTLKLAIKELMGFLKHRVSLLPETQLVVDISKEKCINIYVEYLYKQRDSS